MSDLFTPSTQAPDVSKKARKVTAEQVREALERVLKHLGEMPHDWPSRELFLAYCDAENLLRPDEFTERFMGRAQPQLREDSSEAK